jgi:hypothetical protein
LETFIVLNIKLFKKIKSKFPILFEIIYYLKYLIPIPYIILSCIFSLISVFSRKMIGEDDDIRILSIYLKDKLYDKKILLIMIKIIFFPIFYLENFLNFLYLGIIEY